MNKKKIICIGSGMASLNLALHIPNNVDLTIIASGSKTDCNSFMAKGGVAIPVNEEDIGFHIEDTLIAGDGLCDPFAVEDLITSAPLMLQSLTEKGLLFDQHLALEGGHSRHRIHHLADESGRLLMKQLYQKVSAKHNVKFLYFHHVLNLLVSNNQCYGVVVTDTRSNTILEMRANAIVLATGGSGGLFLNHTNAATSNGEGFALAARAGAALMDMEFIQFHPTTFAIGTSDNNPLITEAFRGAGAILRDEHNNDFMHLMHPLGSLAPRDIVSRSMHELMEKTGAKQVWLDYSSIPDKEIKQHFPALFNLFETNNFHHHKRVPVVPAAHYTCGGVKTDLNGKTNVSSLFAVGEVAATGLHGANRLASNSLMELLIISERIAKQVDQLEEKLDIPAVQFKTSTNNMCWFTSEINNKMKAIMWKYFGIIRNETDMKIGEKELMNMLTEVKSLEEPFAINIELLSMQNKLEAALIIAEQAIERKESRGSHYRSDYPYKTELVDTDEMVDSNRH